MTPRKIERRVTKLLTELCKDAVAREKTPLSSGNYVDIKSFTAMNKWANKTYSLGYTYGHHQSYEANCAAKYAKIEIMDDLRRLEELDKIKICSDFNTSDLIQVLDKSIIEAGKYWWNRMWESQPATCGTFVISSIALLISILHAVISLLSSCNK